MATWKARMIRTFWPEEGAFGRRACRWVLALLFVALVVPAAWAGAEQEVYIRRDNTPLFAAPAEDAKVVLRANAGHRLFVLDRSGDAHRHARLNWRGSLARFADQRRQVH